MGIAEAAHAAQIGRLRRYGRCSGTETLDGPGWSAVMTGVHSNDMNGVVSGPGAITVPLVGELIAWFASVGLPASWLLTGADPRLGEMLIDRGAHPERTGCWAGADLPVHVADRDGDALGVTVRCVTSAADLDDWLEVAGRCGWINNDEDREARQRLYDTVGLDDDELQHWIACEGPTPIGMATLSLLGGVADLCALAVVEDQRRRGVGRRLAAARMSAAHRSGATTVVLAPSHDGWQLYRKLGFRSEPVEPDRCFYLHDPSET